MESQTGMSPKLSPESLKMSLPGINCTIAKQTGVLWTFALPLLPRDPLPTSLSPLSPDSLRPRPPPLGLRGPSGHSNLIRLCPGRQPHCTLTDEGEGGLINVRGWRDCSLIDQSWSNFPVVRGLSASHPGLPWNGWKSPSGGLTVTQGVQAAQLQVPTGTQPAFGFRTLVHLGDAIKCHPCPQLWFVLIFPNTSWL